MDAPRYRIRSDGGSIVDTCRDEAIPHGHGPVMYLTIDDDWYAKPVIDIRHGKPACIRLDQTIVVELGILQDEPSWRIAVPLITYPNSISPARPFGGIWNRI